jgi:hypothetical protein
MIWEHHNTRIVESMGMAWDMGAPMWPFQTPEILVTILNFPAQLLAMPIFIVLRLQTADQRNPILLLAILLLWFGVGRRIDFGLIPQKWARCGMWLPILPILTASASCLVGVYLMVGGLTWWSRYGEVSLSSLLLLTRALGPVPWCFLLTVVAMWGSICLFGLRRTGGY